MNEDFYDTQFAGIAESIDPTRGILYDAAIRHMRSMTGVSQEDTDDDYTYYGLPAAGGSSDMFGEFNE